MTFSRCAALCLLLSLPAGAQDQATTLLAAARAADVVVRARVDAASDPSPEWHRLEFTAVQVLKGTVAGTFSLLEPAGACCGRSLFALQPGEQRLLFLQRRAAVLHPFGGARGVMPAEPAVVAHVAALLAAPHDAAVAHLLVQSLTHDEARIADDAAHALAALPALALGAAHRAAVAAALLAALDRGITRTASLVEVALRVADGPMLDVMLPAYLDAARADRRDLLRRALLRCPPEDVAARLPGFVANEARALRAAELLVALPSATARGAMQQLLREAPHPRIALCLAEGLLAAGASAQELKALVPAPVLELAERRVQRPRAFRAIQPTHR